ncbi:MAG TPA: ABC transporter substrate-binding protein, partial [Firmicutes bacterium]|nr:ABC transporter substrate-binding protein [Bacillota bacterium]
RFTEYAEWVALLFKYADQTILTTGNYDDQVGSFANQKTAFIHQGNWIEPNLTELGADFDRAYAPQGSSKSVTDGIFVSAPSWYVVNKDSEYIQECKDFLTYLGLDSAGHDFVINDLGAAPAFNNVENKPENSPLTMSIMEWAEQGKAYAWNQYYLPESFREALGPIYSLLAQGQIDVEQFIEMMEEQFATLK